MASPTRHRTRSIPVDALQWEGPGGAATLDDFLDWGAPVRLAPDGVVLHLATGGAVRTVGVGDWVVDYLGTWTSVPGPVFGGSYLIEGDASDTHDPGPAQVTFRRVGFRRQRSDGGTEWRQPPLTAEEIAHGGWAPVYGMEVG